MGGGAAIRARMREGTIAAPQWCRGRSRGKWPRVAGGHPRRLIGPPKGPRPYGRGTGQMRRGCSNNAVAAGDASWSGQPPLPAPPAAPPARGLRLRRAASALDGIGCMPVSKSKAAIKPGRAGRAPRPDSINCRPARYFCMGFCSRTPHPLLASRPSSACRARAAGRSRLKGGVPWAAAMRHARPYPSAKRGESAGASADVGGAAP